MTTDTEELREEVRKIFGLVPGDDSYVGWVNQVVDFITKREEAAYDIALQHMAGAVKAGMFLWRDKPTNSDTVFAIVDKALAVLENGDK